MPVGWAYGRGGCAFAEQNELWSAQHGVLLCCGIDGHQNKLTEVSCTLDFWCQIYKPVDSTLWEEAEKLLSLCCIQWREAQMAPLPCQGPGLPVFRPQSMGHTRGPLSLFLSILTYTLPFQVCLVFIHFKYLCTEIAPWIVLRLVVQHNLSIHLSTLALCNSVPIYLCCSKSALLLRKAFQRMLHQPIVK